MADDLGLNQFVGNTDWGSVASQTGNVLSWMFLVIAVLGLIYFLYYLFSFRNVLIVRQMANKRKIIKIYKWKLVKDKTGTEWLKTTFGRIKKTMPPPESIEIGKRGKQYVEAWQVGDEMNLLWIKDDFDETNVPKDFQPLSTTDRELLIDELVRAKQYEPRNLINLILQISMFAVPIIMVVVIALTIGDVSEGLSQMTKSVTGPMNNIAEKFVEASENLQNVQRLSSESANVQPSEVPN